MKKYKKLIEITYANIEEVLKVPIVEGIHKETSGIYREGYGEPYYTCTCAVLDVHGFDKPFGIDYGSVLALDLCDNWYAFSKEQWENHKEDEI